MIRRSCLCLLYGLISVVLAGSVEAQVDTSRARSFGDSLSDNDLVWSFFYPADPGFYGADPFEAMFDKAASPGDELDNYAVLGSTSADVLAQVEYYVGQRRLGLEAPATLISLQGGGNDFIDTQNLLTLASAPPGESDAADQIVNQARQNLLNSIRLLRQVDDAPIVLWTIPDVSLVPYTLFFQLSPEGLNNLSLHAARLNQFIRRQTNRSDIVLLDLAQVLSDVTFDPPALLGFTLFPPPFFGFAQAIFADPIHPTAVANGLLANAMIRELNEELGDTIAEYSELELAEMAQLFQP